MEANTMKKIIFLSLLLASSAYLFFSCTGQSKSASAQETTVEEATAETTLPTKTSFSAKIDGVAIRGDQMDESQLQNTAFHYPGSEPATKRLLFFLYSNKEGSELYSLRFSIPDKVGVFKKDIQDDQPYGVRLDFQFGDFSRYEAQSVTVTINSLTASRVMGTFSGKFTLSNDTPRGKKKEINVQDGKFDIPFSTGTVKPE